MSVRAFCTASKLVFTIMFLLPSTSPDVSLEGSSKTGLGLYVPRWASNTLAKGLLLFLCSETKKATHDCLVSG